MPRPPGEGGPPLPAGPPRSVQRELAQLGIPLLRWIDSCLATAVGMTPPRLLRPTGWPGSASVRPVPPLAHAAAAAIVLGFCPGLGLNGPIHRHFAAWLTLYIEGVMALGRPKQWLWEIVIAIMILDTAGAHEVFSTDDGVARAFFTETRLPIELYGAPPFSVWREGGVGSVLGTAVPCTFTHPAVRPPPFAHRATSFVTVPVFLDDCLHGLVFWVAGTARFRPASLPRHPNLRGRRTGDGSSERVVEADGQPPRCPRHGVQRRDGCDYCITRWMCMGRIGDFPRSSEPDPLGLGLSNIPAPGGPSDAERGAVARPAPAAQHRAIGELYDLAHDHRNPADAAASTDPLPTSHTRRGRARTRERVPGARGAGQASPLVFEPAPEPAGAPSAASADPPAPFVTAVREAIDPESGRTYFWAQLSDNTNSDPYWDRGRLLRSLPAARRED